MLTLKRVSWSSCHRWADADLNDDLPEYLKFTSGNVPKNRRGMQVLCADYSNYSVNGYRYALKTPPGKESERVWRRQAEEREKTGWVGQKACKAMNPMEESTSSSLVQITRRRELIFSLMSDLQLREMLGSAGTTRLSRFRSPSGP